MEKTYEITAPQLATAMRMFMDTGTDEEIAAGFGVTLEEFEAASDANDTLQLCRWFLDYAVKV